MKRAILVLACAAIALSHETLTTTVLFDREIVRVLDRHCVMCHAERGPAFPLETYEQTWLQKRPIRADVIARHMPPWAAVQGYGEFANENAVTLRESQFIISWVEGLGPRNSGTVFTNVSDPTAPKPKEVRAHADFDHWELGEPKLKRQLPAITIEPGTNEVKRVAIDVGLTTERRLSGLEFLPGDRRVVRAAFFTIKETGQWIGSWTPWYGFVSLPKSVAYRLPPGSHVEAEIHFRGTKERITEQGTLGLHFADQPVSHTVSDVELEAKGPAEKLHASVRLTSDIHALALLPQIEAGMKSIEVSARKPDGSTQVLLFAKDFPLDWPTPYIFKTPVALSKGTEVSAVAHYDTPRASLRLTISKYQ